MKYFYCFLLFLISQSLLGQVITQELENEIERRAALKINPSIAIGILLPDGTTEFYGFGKLEGLNKKPDSLTLYEIGSLTKTFTATLTDLYLKDSLHTPISSFYPSISNPNLAKITAAELRNHMAGLPRLSDQFAPKNWSDPFNGYSVAILNKELSDAQTDTLKTWRYSNFGYGILGRAIENTTHKSYDFLMQNLLDKIGMENTLTHLASDNKHHIAQPTNIGTPNTHWNFTGPSRYAGGLISNTTDLLTYLQFHKKHNPLFSSEAIAQPIQTGVPDLGDDMLFYQDGWFVLKPNSTTEILLHNGGTGGFISFVGFNKNTEVGVVVLSNAVNVVDDIGINILYPTFKLNHPERSIAYELAEDIDAGNTDHLVRKYNQLKSEKYPNNIIDIYWLERYHFGKGHYSISTQLSDIMVQEFPEDWEVHDIKGQNLQELEDYDNAIIAYQKALKLNPAMGILQEKINHCSILAKN